MDNPRTIPRSSATFEVFVARWRTGVYFQTNLRSRTVHHDSLPNLRASGPHSSLAVLHSPAKERRAVEPNRHLGVRLSDSRSAAGIDGWNLDVFAFEALYVLR